MDTGWRRLRREFRTSPLAQFGAAMVLLLVICVAFAPVDRAARSRGLQPARPEQAAGLPRERKLDLSPRHRRAWPRRAQSHHPRCTRFPRHRDRRGRDRGRHRGDARHVRGLLRRRVGYVDHALRRRAALDSAHSDGAARGCDPGSEDHEHHSCDGRCRMDLARTHRARERATDPGRSSTFSPRPTSARRVSASCGVTCCRTCSHPCWSPPRCRSATW